MKSLKELCLSPKNNESFGPERMTQIEQALIEDHKSDMPWYLRIIVGIGAWLASCFFLGFVIVLVGDQEEHRITIGFIGIALLVAAVIIGRQKWGIFIGQCALAVSLAGQAMIYWGYLPEQHHTIGSATAFSIGLATLLYLVYPDFLSRLLTCFAALQITLFWIYVGNNGDLFSDAYRARPEFSLLLTLCWMLHLGGICWCFLRGRNFSLLAPLGYALLISLATWQLESLIRIWSYAYEVHYSIASINWVLYHQRIILTALTLFGISTWAVGGISILHNKAPLFIGLALALTALVWLGAGGIILALLFLLLGFSLQNRPILGLGLIMLPVFLIHYYYNLNLDLLAKSGVLIGSGLVLLMLRTSLARWTLTDPKEAA